MISKSHRLNEKENLEITRNPELLATLTRFESSTFINLWEDQEKTTQIESSIKNMEYDFFVKNQKNKKYNSGYINDEYISKLIRGKIFDDKLSYYYYILCGPDKMVESVKKSLNKLRIRDEFIVYL